MIMAQQIYKMSALSYYKMYSVIAEYVTSTFYIIICINLKTDFLRLNFQYPIPILKVKYKISVSSDDEETLKYPYVQIKIEIRNRNRTTIPLIKGIHHIIIYKYKFKLSSCC